MTKYPPPLNADHIKLPFWERIVSDARITISPDGSTKTVELSVPKAFMENLQHNTLRSLHIVRKCREAGIPIVGSLFITGLDAGKLEMEFEPLDEDYIIRWTGPNVPVQIDDDEI